MGFPGSAGKQGAGNRIDLFILLPFALFIVASTCHAVFTDYHPIPYGDNWTIFGLYRDYLAGKLGLGAFWRQHYEHRILFPKILFLLDDILVHGSGYLLISLMLLFQGLHALLLSASLWRNRFLTDGERLFFSGLAFVFMFWLIQHENFIWTFQTSFLLNGLSASVAAYLMCRASEGGRSSWILLVFAAFCCAVAAYSLANGMFMWGVLFLVAWKSGLSRNRMIFWILFGLALVASYCVNYHTPPDHPSLSRAFHFQTLHFFLVYLGLPLSKLSVTGGALLGASAMPLFLFFAWRFMASREPDFFQKFAFALTAYVVLTAAVTAMGRHTLGLQAATTGRYVTPALVFWFVLLAQLYTGVRNSGRATASFRAGILLFLVVVVLPIQLMAMNGRSKSFYVKCDEGSLALMAGVRDSSRVRHLCDNDSLIDDGNGFLRRERLSVYRDPWTLTLGRNFSEAFGLDSNSTLQGEVSEIQAVDSSLPGGCFVRGKVHGLENGKQPGVILFVNDGVVAGFAKTSKRGCLGCFSGYVKGLGNARVEMYALEAENSERVQRILMTPENQSGFRRDSSCGL